jgi:hypothetical protein
MSIATAENGWVNTVEGQTAAVIEQARLQLETTLYGTLSTCSPEGWPWASPIFFAYDAGWNLYWSSAIAARHSQNLYANQGRAAIAIYSTQVGEGQGQGVYFSGSAAELADQAVPEILPLLLQRAKSGQRRSPADYLGNSPRRIYRLVPQAAWITGPRMALSETILVDTKIQLDLTQIRPPKD